MFKPSDFEIPTTHPYGMLEGKTRQASEKENVLAFLLKYSIEKNPEEFEFVTMKYWHDDMVAEGFLLKGEGKNNYKLSNRSINILFAYYGKNR